MGLPEHTHEQLNSDGIHREKMMSLGALTAGVAHELNNPIGYIASNINSLQKYVLAMRDMIEQARDMIAPDQQASWDALIQEKHWDYIKEDILSLIEETTDGSEHLKAVVADLKMLGRSSLSTEYISPDSCVRSALNVMTHQLKSNTQVESSFGNCQPILLIRSQIIQAVTNLIHNAVQAMQPSGGKLYIETMGDENASLIRIEDSGPGVTAASQAHIFDAYYTTKDSQQGSGLGLAIVREIMRQHHGDISYSTGQKYGGACFTLKFPAVTHVE